MPPKHDKKIKKKMGYTLTYDDELKKSIWRGFPDLNYLFEGEDILVWEREIINEDGKKETVKTYKLPIRITADFKPESIVYGLDKEGKIEGAAVKKFGGALKGFVWLDNVSGGGEVIFPFTAPHIFIAKGSRLLPELIEIFTDPKSDNYYKIVDEKTHVFVQSFSGVGGAAGSPPTLIAEYKMNDRLATAVILDSSGNGHNGAVKDATGTATSAFHSVVGKINRAQDLDGTDDYIKIPDHANFTPASTPFSIETWIYMHDTSNFRIITKGVFNTDAEWLLRIFSNKLGIFFYDESVDDCFIGRSYDTALVENRWYHSVATYDGGTLTSGIGIYVDGKRVDDKDIHSNPDSFVAVENLNAPVYIGRLGTDYADGLIDITRFYNKVLTLDEIKRLYNNGHGTEILTEVDEPRLLLRRNNSQFGLRSRYEK